MHITTWDEPTVRPKTPLQASERISNGGLDWFIRKWAFGEGMPEPTASKPHHLILAHPWSNRSVPSQGDEEFRRAASLTKAIGTYARAHADAGSPLLGVWFDHPSVGPIRRMEAYMNACTRFLLSPVRDVLEFMPPIPVSQYGILRPMDERLPLCRTLWTLDAAIDLAATAPLEDERGVVVWVRGPWQWSPNGGPITRQAFSTMLTVASHVGVTHAAVWNDGRRADAERIERDMAYGIDWSRGVPMEWSVPLRDVPPATFDMDGLLDVIADWGPDGMRRLLHMLAHFEQAKEREDG